MQQALGPETTAVIGRTQEVLKQRLKLFASKVDDPGKQFIKKTFAETQQDAWSTLQNLQIQLSIQSPKCEAAIQFLILLGVPQNEIVIFIFQQLKETLLDKLLLLNDLQLNYLLKETILFLSNTELKSIPLTILRRLQKIPAPYLKLLIEKNYIEDCPVSIRRQAWEVYPAYFIRTVNHLCESSIKELNNGLVKSNIGGFVLQSFASLNVESVKQLCERIGSSEILFKHLANYAIDCYKKLTANMLTTTESSSAVGEESVVAKSNVLKIVQIPSWGSLLIVTLLRLHESNSQQMKSLVKLHDISCSIERCYRTKKIDLIGLQSIRDVIKAIVSMQYTLEEREFAKQVQVYNDKHGIVTLRTTITGHGGGLVRPPSIPAVGQLKNGAPAGQLRVSNQVLLKAWKFLSERDLHNTFALPVTEEIAPGYTNYIAHPMDLSTVKRKIQQSQYNSLEAFHKDILLIFQNCVKYNGAESIFGKHALQMHRGWKTYYERLHKTLSTAPVSPPPEPIASPNMKPVVESMLVVVQPKVVKKEKTSNKNGNKLLKDMSLTDKLNSLWKFIKERDINSAFLKKVTNDIAPGYTQMIRNPMWMGLIKQRIDANKYTALGHFESDLMLMFRNCIEYNTEASPLGQFAASLRSQYKQQKAKLLEESEADSEDTEEKTSVKSNKQKMEETSSAEKKTDVVTSPLNEQKFKTPVSGSKVPLVIEKSATSTATKRSNKLPTAAEPVTSVKSSKDLNAYKAEKLHELYMEAWEKMRNFDVNNWFVDKVTDAIARGYSRRIKHPMYLNLIRNKIEENKYSSLDQMQDDVYLMFDNCVLYNGAGADISKVALKGKELWDKNYEVYKSKEENIIAMDTVETLVGESKVPLVIEKSATSTVTKSSNKLPSTSTAEPVTSVKSSKDLNAYKAEKLHELYMETWEKMRNFDVYNSFVDKVTDKIAPGYSSTIKKPMYLNLIRNKIEENKYSLLDQMQDDVYLMFDNCILWNTEEAEISMTALKGKELWKMNYTIYKSREEDILSMDASDIPVSILPDTIPYDILRPHLVECWKYVDSLDTKHDFKEKVIDKIAPGYSHMIRKPMYLSLIKTNIQESKYLNLKMFSNDVILMCKNSIHFNGAETNFGKVANKILTNWLKKEKDIEAALIKELQAKNLLGDSSSDIKTISSSSVNPESRPASVSVNATKKNEETVTSPTASSTNHAKDKSKLALVTSKPPPAVPLTPKLKQDPTDFILPIIITNDMQSLHNLKEIIAEAWYYIHQMDILKAFDKLFYEGSGIANPVDLSSIHQKIESMSAVSEPAAGSKQQGKGYKSWDDFNKDIQIMWKNHVRLRPEKYEIEYGKQLAQHNKLIEEYLIARWKLLESAEWTLEKDYEILGSSALWTPQSKPFLARLQAMNSSVNAKTQQTNSYFTILDKLLRFCIEFLVSLDKEKHFNVVVDDRNAPGYSKLIRQPVSISTVKSKLETHAYKSLDTFNDDVFLLIKNCLTYNSPDSLYSLAALTLGSRWIVMHHLIQKKFPFLSDKLRSVLHDSSAVMQDSKPSAMASNHDGTQIGGGTAAGSNAVPAPSGVISKIAKRKRHSEEDEIVESKAEVPVKKEQADQKILKRSKIEEQRDSKLQSHSTAAALSNESMDVEYAEKVEDKKSHISPVTKLSSTKKLKRNSNKIDDDDDEEEFDDDYKPRYAIVAPALPEKKELTPIITVKKTMNVEEEEEGEIHEDEIVGNAENKVGEISMEVEEDHEHTGGEKVKGEEAHEEQREEEKEDQQNYNEQEQQEEANDDDDGEMEEEAAVAADENEDDEEGREEEDGDDEEDEENDDEDEEVEEEDQDDDSNYSGNDEGEGEDNEEQRAKEAAELLNENSDNKNDEVNEEGNDGKEDMNPEEESSNVVNTSNEGNIVDKTNDEVQNIMIVSGKGEYFNESNDSVVSEEIKLSKLFSYKEMEDTINECMDYDQPSKSNCPMQLLANIHDYLDSVDSEKHFTSPMKVQMNYPKYIPNPIHLNSIRLKIERGLYADRFVDYLADIQLLITNCIKLYCVLKRSELPEDEEAVKLIPFKAMQRFNYAWSIVSTNMKAILYEQPELAIHSVDDKHLETTNNKATETAQKNAFEVLSASLAPPPPTSTITPVATTASTTIPTTIITERVPEESEATFVVVPAVPVSTVTSSSTAERVTTTAVNGHSKASIKDNSSAAKELLTADTSVTAIPPTDSDEPTPSALFLSLQKARSVLVSQGNQEVGKLQPLPALEKSFPLLSWTLLMLSDAGWQYLLIQHLALLLHRQYQKQYDYLKDGISTDKIISLPNDSDEIKFIVQLCQVNLTCDLVLHEVQEDLVRVYIPMIVVACKTPLVVDDVNMEVDDAEEEHFKNKEGNVKLPTTSDVPKIVDNILERSKNCYVKEATSKANNGALRYFLTTLASHLVELSK